MKLIICFITVKVLKILTHSLLPQTISVSPASKSALLMALYTFFQDGYFYTAVNAVHLPPVPPHPNPPLLKLEDIQGPLWLTNNHPYLALVPVAIRFTGSILSRFSHTSGSLPVGIRPEHGQWALSRSLMERWYRLEGALHWLIPTLHHLSRYGLQPGLKALTSPRFTGYCLGYKDERSARRGAISSRDAFVPKLAELSWGLLMHPGNAMEKTPQWMSVLMNTYKVHPEWVYALRECVFGDFSPQNP